MRRLRAIAVHLATEGDDGRRVARPLGMLRGRWADVHRPRQLFQLSRRRARILLPPNRPSLGRDALHRCAHVTAIEGSPWGSSGWNWVQRSADGRHAAIAAVRTRGPGEAPRRMTLAWGKCCGTFSPMPSGSRPRRHASSWTPTDWPTVPPSSSATPGRGLPAAWPFIFDRFWQADRSLARTQGSPGLGWRLCGIRSNSTAGRD